VTIKNTDRALVKKIEYIIILCLTLIVIGALIKSIINHNIINISKSLGTLLLMYIPKIIAKKSKINLTSEFHIILQLFIFAGVFLGSVCRFYYQFWWLDGTLHGFRGFLLGFTGFIVLFMMYRDEIKSSMRLSFIVIFMFSFSASFSVLWEIQYSFIFKYFQSKFSLSFSLK